MAVIAFIDEKGMFSNTKHQWDCKMPKRIQAKIWLILSSGKGGEVSRDRLESNASR
jgi:hypothetical protein